MNFFKTIKSFVAEYGMKSLIVTSMAIGTVAFTTVAYGTNNSSDTACLDGSRYQSFRVSYQSRTTGTLSTANGLPLCKDASMIFQSFDFASTWDGKNFLTSLPQTVHGYKNFTFPGKKANHKVTVSVAAPDECKPTQIDFYTGSSVVRKIPKSNPHYGEDREVRSGKIFNATEECKVPVYECSSLSRIKKDRDSYTFRGKAKVENGAVLKGFTYNLGDGTTKYVAHTKHASDTRQYKYVDLDHDYAKAGEYSVKITAHFTANNKTMTKTSANCQKPVTVTEVPAPELVEVCDPATGDIITVDKKDQDEYLPVNDPACNPETTVEEEVTVCDPETGKIITVKESEADNYAEKDSDECKEDTPVITELPKTGLGTQLSGILGVGTLTSAAYYYISSRRNV